MAFTDHSDLFGSVHEDGINLVVRHFMRQRPSLFNYATPTFHARPELFCRQIDSAPRVRNSGNPTFTEQAPLPILGSPVPLGLDFCLQFTDFEVDFHPSNAIDLPPELEKLGKQQFALRASACAGMSCPPRESIDELVPAIERFLVAQRLAAGDLKEVTDSRRRGTSKQVSPQDVAVLPTRQLECFCLELFMVGHFEWGSVGGSVQPWLKTRIDGVEIVDLRPEKMENALECYAVTVLRLGILPRLIVPMETMILDVTSVLQQQGFELGKLVTVAPAAVPADVPNNPALEDDLLKAFIKLSVTDLAP